MPSDPKVLDVSNAFPDYERATVQLVGFRIDLAEVRLYSGGTFSRMNLKIDGIHMLLENCRKLQPGTKSAMAALKAEDDAAHEFTLPECICGSGGYPSPCPVHDPGRLGA